MVMKEKLVEVKLVDIEEPGHKLRKTITEEGLDELKASMGKRGLIQPIELRPKGEKFEIVSGHRRYLSAVDLGWTSIKAIVRERSDEDTVLDALHENLHREDMSPIEEGLAAQLLQEKEGLTIKEIAKMFAKSESWVVSRLDLVGYPRELREAVDVGAISVSAARELNGILDDDARAYYTSYAVKQGATAMLCAYWRGQWELQRLTHAPLGSGGQSAALNPPPMVVQIQCQWCYRETEIGLIEHLRVCPDCLRALLQARADYLQEQAKRGANA